MIARAILSALILVLSVWAPAWADLPPVEAVGGVSLPGVPPSVARAAVKAGEAARESVDAQPDPGIGVPVTAESSAEIVVAPNSTELVRISRGYLNRIITPFENPKLLTTNAVEVKEQGASIFLATSSDKPVGVFILSNDPADTRGISLTLVPARIPPRTITLKWPDDSAGFVPASLNGKAKRWEESAPYEDKLFELVVAVARGEVPNGYTFGQPTEQLACSLPGVSFITGQKLTGSHFSVFVLKATNTGRGTLELLSNAGCNIPGLMLVAPWPRAYIEAGQSTEVFVAVNNETFNGAKRSSIRPSLLAK